VVGAIATIAKRPNFWQRGIGVFAAQLCYAKIAPAALHRGEFRGCCREGTEAAGPNPKFPGSNFRRRQFGASGADGASVSDGMKLCKACPMLEPFKQAIGRGIA
jgi:hypothetical protein